MTEPSNPGAPAARERLLELARLLRESRHLGPGDRRELADLVAELAGTLGPDVPAEQSVHLAESTEHLVRALNQHRQAGPLAAAKDRLGEAAVRVEARAPVAAGVARRLVDLLADLGI